MNKLVGPAAKILGVIALCLVSGLIGGALSKHFGESSYTLSYADFVSVILTAISVLMTVLTIFLGVLGVIGWNAITSRVHDRTEDFLNEGFKEGNPLYNMLRTRATEIMYEGVTAVDGTNEADDTFNDQEPPADEPGNLNG